MVFVLPYVFMLHMMVGIVEMDFAMTLIYIGAMTLLGGRSRHLMLAIPTILFYIAFVLDVYISIRSVANTDRV